MICGVLGAWDDFKRFFPDNRSGNRIIVTTRLARVVIYASSCSPLHYMNLLSYPESWKLLRSRVFGEAGCPHQLSKVGRKIAFDCKGLPLAIVVMAGLLSKVNRTRDEWTKVAKNLHSVANKNADAWRYYS
ncbi:hypothetical protein Pfo_025634 [Paulownia fortunei]|nr:hypothetical protein Pfo_025634 [Paulownia fortunei]